MLNPLGVLYKYGLSQGMDQDAFFDEQEIEFLLCVKNEREFELKRLHGPRKTRGEPMLMPIPLKRTSGIKANFPADNPVYVLGMEFPEERVKADPDWSARCHEEYVKIFERAALETKDRGLATIARFFRERGDTLKNDPQVKGAEIQSGDTVCPAVWRAGVGWQVASGTDAVRDWWRKNYGALQDMEGEKMVCSVTGKEVPAARIHPLVTGMKGGRTTGITFLTYNEPSLESWGHSQGATFPISVEAAIICSKALSRIISRKSGKRRSILLPGDVNFCVLTPLDPEERAADFVMSLLDPLEKDIELDPESGHAEREVYVWRAHRELLKSPYTGELAPSPDSPVDILLVRPNGARVEVRSYVEKPFGDLQKNLRRYFEDLSISDPFRHMIRSDFVLKSVWVKADGPDGKAKKVAYGLMEALKNEKNGEYPRWEVLTGMYMAALEDKPFPPDVLRLSLARITQKSKNPVYGAVPIECAALIKASLNRELRRPGSNLLSRWHSYDENFNEVKPMLDSTCKHPAYVNGRLMAIAQRIQEIAIPGVGGSVVVKFFDAASKSPGSIMPGILKNMNNHMNKIFRAKPGLSVWCQKLVGEVLNLLPAEREKSFPKALDFQDQGLFTLGYYHQRDFLFQKKGGSGEKGPEAPPALAPVSDPVPVAV
jgi:CRISPR-associated protein Csd1